MYNGNKPAKIPKLAILGTNLPTVPTLDDILPIPPVNVCVNEADGMLSRKNYAMNISSSTTTK